MGTLFIAWSVSSRNNNINLGLLGSNRNSNCNSSLVRGEAKDERPLSNVRDHDGHTPSAFSSGQQVMP